MEKESSFYSRDVGVAQDSEVVVPFGIEDSGFYRAGRAET
uniref:Uncharacterized protein n=1 Tax=Rhizophora mucronata TaxID=61149 RepID=A0A2P2NR70_RHIMU